MKENEKTNKKYIVDDNETSEDLVLNLSDEELEREYKKTFEQSN